MEQHAVPQDITGFKFKLVGDMTLKQFGELAFGAILAYLFYASGWPGFFRWPAVFLFGMLGFALAFLPIEERPLDLWLANFLRAIYHPTLYTWQKRAAPVIPTSLPSPVKVSATPEGTKKEPAPAPAKEPAPPPPPAPAAPPPPLTVNELEKLRVEKMKELGAVQQRLSQMATQIKGDIYKATRPDIVTIDRLATIRDAGRQSNENRLRELVEQNRNLMQQIETVKLRIQSLQGMDTTQLSAQLSNLGQQKDALAEQIKNLEEKLTPPSVPPPPITNAAAGGTPILSSAQVRVVEPIVRQTNVSLTDTPNVINGIIINDQGAPLDNTIVIIKDQAGNSIRALKTSQVGQFVASTPLETGTYYLEFERPGYQFATLEVVLTGQVLPPIQIRGNAAAQ